MASKSFFLPMCVVALATAALGQAGPATVNIPFTQHTLANGLKVILSEDHHAPTFSLAVMFDVGSRNERPGRTGFAHLFEHLMFEGSANVGKGEYYYLIFNNGGNMNGTTSKDRTVYYETLPANQLPLALFLESDRMRALNITQDALDNQRNAVQEERRLGVDNVPYGTTSDELDQTAYDVSGYRHSVIGSMADLNAASLADVTAFYKTYYAPNNATLVLVGDFNSAAALASIEKSFGNIPRQATPPAVDMAQPAQNGERRKTITDAFAPLPLLSMAYRAPASNTPDWYALDVLGDILAKGRSSRLYRAMVDGEQLANSVQAGPEQTRGPSLFDFSATPRPGKTVAQLEAAFEAAIADVQNNGVTAAEVADALTQDRTDLINQDVSTLGRALAISTDAVFYHDPALINTEIAAYAKVTPAAVQLVAKQYLLAADRTVLVTEPAPAERAAAGAAAAKPAAPGQDAKKPELSQIVHLGRAPVSKAVLQVRLPKPIEATLPNGLKVLVLEDHRFPLVTTSLRLMGAGELETSGTTPGLAAFAAQMLTSGTNTRSATEIAAQSAALGATVFAGAPFGSPDASVVASGRADNFDQWFALATDVLLHPAYPQGELDKLKARTLVGLREVRTSPNFLATERFDQAVYGDFPAAVTAPTPASLDAMTRDQLQRWHDLHYDPSHAILAIAGDVSAATLLPQLGRELASWLPTHSSVALPGATHASSKANIFLIDRPGSVQTTIAMGNIAIARTSPDYFAEVVLNQIFGAGPQSRIFLNLREQHGYTYGVYSSDTAAQYAGAWRAGGDVRTAVTDGSMTQLLFEINRIRNQMVPDDELDNAKKAIVASFALSLEQPAGLVNYAVTRQEYGFATNYWDTYPANIMAVTPQQIQAAARKYYDPAAMQIVAVGDAAAIHSVLEKYGPVTVYSTDGKVKSSGSVR